MAPQDDPAQDGADDAAETHRPLHSGSRWEPGAPDPAPAPPPARRRPGRRGLRLTAAAVGLAAVLGVGALVAGHALDDDGPGAGPAGATAQDHHGDHDRDGDGARGGSDDDGDGPGAPAAPGGVAT